MYVNIAVYKNSSRKSIFTDVDMNIWRYSQPLYYGQYNNKFVASY